MSVPAPMRNLATARLKLEPLVAAHADEMFAVLSDPAIYEYENRPPASVDALRERFEKLETRHSPDGAERWLNWVARLHGGEAIGYVQATVHPPGSAEIAFIFHSRHWGQGLAGEAVEAMHAELAAGERVTSLAAVFKRANHRSRRLLERLGYRRDPDGLRDVLPDEERMVRDLTRP